MRGDNPLFIQEQLSHMGVENVIYSNNLVKVVSFFCPLFRYLVFMLHGPVQLPDDRALVELKTM